MKPEDALSNAIAQTNLVALLERLCPTSDTARLHPERGGLIRDPRPGCEEREPSFSVSHRNGVWLWHRFGRAGAHGRDEGGNAYHLLLSLGYTPRTAAETLLRGTNLEAATPRRPVVARPLVTVSRRTLEALHDAQRCLEGIPALSTSEGERDPTVFARYTHPSGWTWYVLEYDGARTLFGLVAGCEIELGYFDRLELDALGARLEPSWEAMLLSAVWRALRFPEDEP
jgi:hypothetical protein